MISLDLGGKETKVVISEVLNPHAPKILLLTDQAPIGQMIFMGSIKASQKKWAIWELIMSVAHLGNLIIDSR
jgi:hypothetical protein